MEIKIGSIVKKTDTNEIYEVLGRIGKILMCKAVNVNSLKEFNEQGIPLSEDEVEVMMEEETDAFDILFKD